MLGWDTQDEEDCWDVELDFVSPDPDEYEAHPMESDMTVGEMMEWRYIRAEREKEQVAHFTLSDRICAYLCIISSYCYRVILPLKAEIMSKLSSTISLHIRLSPRCHITISISLLLT